MKNSPISISTENVLKKDRYVGKTSTFADNQNMEDVKMIPITIRKTETTIHAAINSTRYRACDSFEYLNEKINEFVDHAIDVASVMETEEKETSAIIE
jgi:hypothetical protein